MFRILMRSRRIVHDSATAGHRLILLQMEASMAGEVRVTMVLALPLLMVVVVVVVVTNRFLLAVTTATTTAMTIVRDTMAVRVRDRDTTHVLTLRKITDTMKLVPPEEEEEEEEFMGNRLITRTASNSISRNNHILPTSRRPSRPRSRSRTKGSVRVRSVGKWLVLILEGVAGRVLARLLARGGEGRGRGWGGMGSNVNLLGS